MAVACRNWRNAGMNGFASHVSQIVNVIAWNPYLGELGSSGERPPAFRSGCLVGSPVACSAVCSLVGPYRAFFPWKYLPNELANGNISFMFPPLVYRFTRYIGDLPYLCKLLNASANRSAVIGKIAVVQHQIAILNAGVA